MGINYMYVAWYGIYVLTRYCKMDKAGHEHDTDHTTHWYRSPSSETWNLSPFSLYSDSFSLLIISLESPGYEDDSPNTPLESRPLPSTASHVYSSQRSRRVKVAMISKTKPWLFSTHL